jgi:hypothetical protein
VRQELAKRLILWLSLSVGIAVVPFVWHPLAGSGRWTQQIYRGELILVSVGLLASGVGYAAMATVRGKLDILKAAIVGPGVLLDSKNRPSVAQVSWTSYAIFVAASAMGFGATYIAYRDEAVKELGI